MLKKICGKMASSQLRLNMVSGFLTTGVGAIVSALKYPLYLHFLDYKVYGAWLMLATLLTMAQFGMLGIGPAITKLVAEELGEKNFDAIEKYLSTAILTLLSSGGLLLFAILLFKPQVLDLLGFNGTIRIIGEKYLMYICLLTVYVFLYQAINSTIAGLGRMDIANYSQATLQLLPLIITIPMLISGKGVVSLLLGNVFAYFVVSVANILFIYKVSKIRIFSFSNISLHYFKKLLQFGIPVCFSSIIGLFFGPLTKIFISNHIGIAAIPIYEVASKIATQVLGLFNMSLKALMPELSRLYSKRTSHSINRSAKIRSKAYQLIVLGGGSLCTVLFIAAPIIFHLWLGQEYKSDISTVFRVLVIGTFASILSLVNYYTLLSLGKTREFFIYHLIFTGINTVALITGFVFCNLSSLLYASISNTLGKIIGAAYLIYFIKTEIIPTSSIKKTTLYK